LFVSSVGKSTVILFFPPPQTVHAIIRSSVTLSRRVHFAPHPFVRSVGSLPRKRDPFFFPYFFFLLFPFHFFFFSLPRFDSSRQRRPPFYLFFSSPPTVPRAHSTAVFRNRYFSPFSFFPSPFRHITTLLFLAEGTSRCLVFLGASLPWLSSHDFLPLRVEKAHPFP